MGLGVVLGVVAEEIPVLAGGLEAGVVGVAVDDQGAGVRVEEAGFGQAGHVVGGEPGGERALVDGEVAVGADAEADRGDAVFLVEAAQDQFAVGLQRTVMAIRPGGHGGGDGDGDGVHAVGMVGTGVDDALHPGVARGLEHLEQAGGVGVPEGFEIGARRAGEVDDGLRTFHDLRHGGAVGDVGLDPAAGRVGRAAEVGEEKVGPARGEAATERGADGAGGAGDDDAVCGLGHGRTWAAGFRIWNRLRWIASDPGLNQPTLCPP